MFNQTAARRIVFPQMYQGALDEDENITTAVTINATTTNAIMPPVFPRLFCVLHVVVLLLGVRLLVVGFLWHWVDCLCIPSPFYKRGTV